MIYKSRGNNSTFLLYLLFIMSIFDGAAYVISFQNTLSGFSSMDVSLIWYIPILLIGPFTSKLGAQLV
jgi:hypothetical protein